MNSDASPADSDTHQAHRLSSANADLTQGVDGATANKQHRIDRAGTRQTYETAQENADQNPGVGFPEFRTGEADTTLTRDTGVADADRTWRYSLASADRTQTRDNATHQKNAQIVQAGLQQSFSNNQALADAGYETALAGHEQTYGSALLTADTVRAVALGNAQLGWLNSSFAADVTELTQLDTLNTDAGDWTTHLVQLATAQQSWWSTFAPNFMAFVNDITDEWADEQTAANLELAQLATANNVADLAYTADVAAATYQATTFLANQSEQREFALADQDELFQQTEAAARRTFDVTSATLTRDGAAAGTPLLDGNAAAQATPAYNAARQAARQAFDLNTALPVAAFSVTQSATNHWWTTQTNAFASTHATARGTALDQFLTNSSQATLTRRQNVANLTSSFEQNWVSSNSSAVSLFASTNPSPWATHAAAKSNAEVVRTSTLAPARAAHDSNVANADHVLLEGLADSLAEYISEQTSLDNNELLAEADNDLSSAILGANGFLNPNPGGEGNGSGEDTTGGGATIDVLSAVSVPGGATAGTPSGFTFNAEATGVSPFLRDLWQGPSALRNAPPTFAPNTRVLPDDHVEASDGNTPRGVMPREHSGSVELQNSGANRNSTTNAANPRTEEKQTEYPPKSQRAAAPPSVELQSAAENGSRARDERIRKLRAEGDRVDRTWNRLRDAAPLVYLFLQENRYEITFEEQSGWEQFWNGKFDREGFVFKLDKSLSDWEAFKWIVGITIHSPAFKRWMKAKFPDDAHTTEIRAMPGSREYVQWQRDEVIAFMRAGGATEAEVTDVQFWWTFNDWLGPTGHVEIILIGLSGFARGAADAHRLRERANTIAASGGMRSGSLSNSYFAELARRRSLGTSSSGYDPLEEEAALELERQRGIVLTRDMSNDADWLGPYGKSYDRWGVKSEFFQKEFQNGNLLRSLRKHLDGLKTDFGVVDTEGLTAPQIAQLRQLISTLSEAERGRIIDLRNSLRLDP